jgi:two-component system response regulator GlrR
MTVSSARESVHERINTDAAIVTHAASERPTGRRQGDRIVAASDRAQQALDQAALAARSSAPVLLWGPSGSGRKHHGRAIHAWSSRGNGPLVVFSALSTPEALHSRELFGATNSEPLLSGDREGAISRAAGGALLIERVDLLSPSLRQSLIRAIEEASEARPVDGRSVPLDARIIATADQEADRPFGDLSVQTISITGLDQRSEDILPLAAHFLAGFAEEEGRKAIGFTADARRWLCDEPWQGNVRELRERIRQALHLAGDGVVSAEALMLATDGDGVPSFKEAKRAFETRYVEGLLRRCCGNISRAARLAKKDRKDFYDVIRRTGVDPSLFRS